MFEGAGILSAPDFSDFRIINQHAFDGACKNCSNLTDAGAMAPQTIISTAAFYQMYANDGSLTGTSGVVLSAVYERCYWGMF